MDTCAFLKSQAAINIIMYSTCFLGMGIMGFLFLPKQLLPIPDRWFGIFLMVLCMAILWWVFTPTYPVKCN